MSEPAGTAKARCGIVLHPAGHTRSPAMHGAAYAALGLDADYRAFGAYDLNRHFVDCLLKEKKPETHFDDAVKTMELVDAVYGSQI